MTRALPYFVVDAFTSRRFAGNPAAVVPLADWLPDALLQQIAGEMALSETAFFVAEPDGFHLRWMTPTVEVELCGHATLASAFVIGEVLEPGRAAIRFRTRSGALEVARAGERLTLDLPARPAVRLDDPGLRGAVSHALGAEPLEVWQARNLMAVFAEAGTVRGLAPDLRAVRALPGEGLIATAPGDGEVDFVSRYFTPQHGVDEDPVTGSTHCTLTPYWAARLGRPALVARQVSQRGGELAVALAGARVQVTGTAVLMARGELYLG
jgi:PhzF family phenazine biosynthesis protein